MKLYDLLIFRIINKCHKIIAKVPKVELHNLNLTWKCIGIYHPKKCGHHV